MDNNPPIYADELQIEFDMLEEVFRGDNSFAKFEASAEMMVLISRYLSNNIQSIDESFGHWLQKASGLSGYSAHNWQLWTVRQNVESATGTEKIW